MLHSLYFSIFYSIVIRNKFILMYVNLCTILYRSFLSFEMYTRHLHNDSPESTSSNYYFRHKFRRVHSFVHSSCHPILPRISPGASSPVVRENICTPDESCSLKVLSRETSPSSPTQRFVVYEYLSIFSLPLDTVGMYFENFGVRIIYSTLTLDSAYFQFRNAYFNCD